MSSQNRDMAHILSHQYFFTALKQYEAGNFGFRKKRNCTIRVAKTKALISFAIKYCEADLRLCFRGICEMLVFS